jgi:diguanylate cyclase (GGDEF)-like protein
MPETSAEEAHLQASNLLNELMSTRFRMKGDLELSIRASVGLATAPTDGVTVHAVIGAADTRMYMVKSNGRGQVWRH